MAIAIICPNQFYRLDIYQANSENEAVYAAVKEAFLHEYNEDIDIRKHDEYNEDKEGVDYVSYLASHLEAYILIKEVYNK